MNPGLRVGDEITLRDSEGSRGKVVMLSGSMVTAILDDGQTVALTFGEFYDKTGDGVVPRRTPPKPVNVDDSALAEARELADHLIEVKTGLRPGAKKPAPGYDPATTSIGEREELKIAEFEKLPEGHPFAEMSLGSLRRKRSRFASGGVPGLIDKRKTKLKTRFGRQDDTVIGFIREQLDAQPDGPAISVSTFHRQVERRIEEYNKTAKEPIDPPPSRSTVERVLKGLPEAKYVFGDATRRRSNDSSPYADLTPFYASRPGDEVQIDSTKLNCWVRSSDGKRMFRPELTLAIDVATRVVVGYRLTEESANAIDAAEVLAKILTPEPFRDGWEDRLRYSYESVPHERAMSLDKRLEKAARIPVIFPHNIIIDNGRTFISHVFFEACEQFGISIQTARPATGHDKAIVERFFRSLEARFLEHLDGAYTGRSVGRKGRKNPNPEDLAYTLEQLDDLFAEYIVIYHDIEHDGLHIPHFEDMGVSPNKMYDFLVGAHGYLPAPATFSETIDVLPKEERTIQQYGVRIHNRTFDSPALNHIRRQANPNAADGKWTFRYHTDETRFIYFKDETNDEVYAIPWIYNKSIGFEFSERTYQEAYKKTNSTDPLAKREADALNHLRKLNDKLANGEQGTGRPRNEHHQRDIEETKLELVEDPPTPEVPGFDLDAYKKDMERHTR